MQILAVLAVCFTLCDTTVLKKRGLKYFTLNVFKNGETSDMF